MDTRYQYTYILWESGSSIAEDTNPYPGHPSLLQFQYVWVDTGTGFAGFGLISGYFLHRHRNET
jgi:hypothetical protein